MSHTLMTSFSDFCGWETNSAEYLKLHERHHNNNLYKCEFCGKYFRDEHLLNCHKKDHTAQKVPNPKLRLRLPVIL